MSESIIPKLRSCLLTHLVLTLLPPNNQSGLLEFKHFFAVTETQSPSALGNQMLKDCNICTADGAHTIPVKFQKSETYLSVDHCTIYVCYNFSTDNPELFEAYGKTLQEDISVDKAVWYNNDPWGNNWTPHKIVQRYLYNERLNMTLSGISDLFHGISHPKL